MKILLVSYPNSIHTQRWVASLCEKGVEVALCGSKPPEPTLQFYYEINNCTLFWEEPEKSSFLSKIAYLRLVFNLKRIIRQWKPDIVHAHWATRYGLICALSGFHPFITSVWGSDVFVLPQKHILYRWIIKFVFRQSDYIFSTSHSMAEEAKKYTNKGISITPFGVDTNLFKSNSEPDRSAFVVGNVKTLDPIYGIDILIEAFNIVVKNNPKHLIKLVIVGDGPYKDNYIKLVEELNLKDFVSFTGKVQNVLLPSYYNSFSVTVLPSRSESFGVVAVEAMSCECPVIVSDASGFMEIVEDGVSGFIVKREDIYMTALAIQRFIDDPLLRDKLGKEGRKRVLKYYSWDDNVGTMISLYNNILSEFRIK